MVKKRPSTAAAALPPRVNRHAQVDAAESHGNTEAPAENLQFGALCAILEPNPTIRSPIWMQHIDRHEKIVLLYQLDLHSTPASMRKTLQIRSRTIPLASGPRNVLIPVAHLGAVQVPIGIIKDKIGRSFIANAADVQTILDFLHNSTAEDIVQTGENSETVRSAAVSSAAPKTSRKRPISSDRESDDDNGDQQPQLAALELSRSASRRGREVTRLSVIARGSRTSSEASRSSTRKPARGRPRLTTPKKKPRGRPKTTHGIRVIAPPSLTSRRATGNGDGKSAQANRETESHCATSSNDQAALTQDLILPLVVKYRELVCKELGIPVKGDIPQPLEPKVVAKAKKIIMGVCQTKPEQEGTWTRNIGSAIRFGLRSARVWKEFMLMYQKLENHNKLDQIKMYQLRDIFNRVNDDEAIRLLRECSEKTSSEALRKISRTGIQSYLATGVGLASKSGSSSAQRNTEEDAMELDDSRN